MLNESVAVLAVIALAMSIVTLALVIADRVRNTRHRGADVVEGWDAAGKAQKTVGHDDPTRELLTPVDTPSGLHAARHGKGAGK